jgi:hypothetical protein
VCNPDHIIDKNVISIIAYINNETRQTIAGFGTVGNRESVQIIADPGGRAVWCLGLQTLACRDCGFESRLGHGCLGLGDVVCCQVEVSASA